MRGEEGQGEFIVVKWGFHTGDETTRHLDVEEQIHRNSEEIYHEIIQSSLVSHHFVSR